MRDNPVVAYGRSNASIAPAFLVMHRPLRPPLAVGPRHRAPAGRVGGRAPALVGRGLMHPARGVIEYVEKRFCALVSTLRKKFEVVGSGPRSQPALTPALSREE